MSKNDSYDRYERFYSSVAAYFEGDEAGVKRLNALNKALRYIMYFAYAAVLVWAFALGAGGGGGFLLGLERVLPYILIPGASFIILSIIRNAINFKRPYEEHDIIPLIAKTTKGKSNPSRHVFSCAIISMCAMTLNTAFGIVLLVLTLLSACVRVIGGVHYPRDVIWGLAAGLACGAVMFAFK